MPQKWRSKILLARIETTYGTDPGPTAAAHAVLATEVVLSPMEGSDVSRDLDRPYLAAQATIPAELHATLAMKVELAPSGTAGTAPAWGPLLRGCGVAEVVAAGASVTYTPVSDTHESLTLHLWIGDTRYVLTGCRGTCVLRFAAQAIPYLEFAFTGLYAPPAEAARGVPVLSGFRPPEVVSKARTPVFTVAGTPLVMRQAMLDLGNAVEPRFLVGSESILITDRADAFTATVEAEALSVLNPFALAEAQTPVAVSLVHGTAAGRRATLGIPAAQMQRLSGLENAQNILEWPLRLTPLPVSGSGNDQWTLTLT